MEMPKLKMTRMEKGLTQAQLSEASGISIRTIQQYERRALDVNGAKLVTLLKLCDALDCGLTGIIDDPATLEMLYNRGIS